MISLVSWLPAIILSVLRPRYPLPHLTAGDRAMLRSTESWPTWLVGLMVRLLSAPPLTFWHLWGRNLAERYVRDLERMAAASRHYTDEARLEMYLLNRARESRKRGRFDA